MTEIIIGIDDERLAERLNTKGYVVMKKHITNTSFRKDYFPISKGILSTLEPEAILESYNSVLRGICSYYAPVINDRWRLNKYFYYLNFSCKKTLAQKYRSTMNKLFLEKGSRFGLPP